MGKKDDHGNEIIEVQKDYIKGLEENVAMMKAYIRRQEILLKRIYEDMERDEKND